MKKNFKILMVLIASLVMAVSCFCVTACNKTNEGTFKVSYESEGNGFIYGEAVQTLKSGEYTTMVKAMPDEGYQFVRWSDMKTDSIRFDVVKDKDVTVSAIFEKRKFSVTYFTDPEYGTIEGNADQTVEYGETATTVTAVPNFAYKFVEWADTGSTDPVRTDTDIKNSINARAVFVARGLRYIPIRYSTDGHGKIDGYANQKWLEGNDANPVTAVPDDGYEFIGWSDGVETAERHDLCVTDDINVTAQFKQVFKRFKLDYGYIKTDEEITELIFYVDDFKTQDFPVPTRKPFNFCGWYVGDTQITDENSKMIAGKEILDCEESEATAKWTTDENYTYKVLLIYINEIDAQLTSRKGNGIIDFYYKLSDFDLKICKLVTLQVRNYLNLMLEGLVTFEVDEYFTTEVVGNASIDEYEACKSIIAREIPEIYNSGIYKEYQSILTVFNQNDYSGEFRVAAGIAGTKYGTVFLDTVYESNLLNREPLEYILDLNFWRWDEILQPFIHELAHTMEMQIRDAYPYHYVIAWLGHQGIVDTFTMNKLYLLNALEFDGIKVGIPYEFWTGEMDLRRGDW